LSTLGIRARQASKTRGGESLRVSYAPCSRRLRSDGIVTSRHW